MEKLKLGKNEYELITSIGEMRYDKMLMFNQYIIAIFQGLDTTLFALTMDKVRHHFDKGNFIQGYQELVNFDTAIKFKEHQIDPMGMAFALMLKGDDTDEDVLKEKIVQMTKDGLAWETVKKKVWAFMSLLPEKFGAYLQVSKMLENEIDL